MTWIFYVGGLGRYGVVAWFLTCSGLHLLSHFLVFCMLLELGLIYFVLIYVSLQPFPTCLKSHAREEIIRIYVYLRIKSLIGYRDIG